MGGSARVAQERREGRKDDGVKVFIAAKYGSVKVFIVAHEQREGREG